MSSEDKYLAGLLLAVLKGIRKIVVGTPKGILKAVFLPIIHYLMAELKKLKK